MRLTYDRVITVIAATKGQATEKAEQCDWHDDGEGTGEIVDWDRRGEPEDKGDA